MIKKQIAIPIAILVTGIIAMVGFASLKKPPEEKPEVDNTPIVAVSDISVAPMTLVVNSHGMVKPKYETQLIAQVKGEIVELSDIFVRGGFVKKNQLLARIDPNDYEADLIDAQAAMATARAALEQEVAQGKVAEREWKLITDTSPTELSLRKPQLAQELARVKSAQASVLRAKRNLERTEIRSPYDAMIESRNIGLGSFVSIGNKLGHVLATDTAEVRLPVADNQLAFLVNQGVNAQVNLIGVYAGKATQWRATIKRNEGVIDSKSRMSYLVAELHDPYQLKTKEQANTPLRFGSYINANIVGKNIPQATKVPRHLVLNGKVALLDSDSTLRYATLNIVRQQASYVIVSNGLSSGDRLIVSALDYPIDGMKLAIVGEESQVEENPAEKSLSGQIAAQQSETQQANNTESGE
ncbi:MAG: efflux RND transporter periplasmic adaptor subunit [Colwellia sp.]